MFQRQQNFSLDLRFRRMRKRLVEISGWYFESCYKGVLALNFVVCFVAIIRSSKCISLNFAPGKQADIPIKRTCLLCTYALEIQGVIGTYKEVIELVRAFTSLCVSFCMVPESRNV